MEPGSHPCSRVTDKASPVELNACGRGLIATQPIVSGEVVAAFGGKVLDEASFRALPPRLHRLGLQIDEHLYLVSAVEGPADWLNHGCDPNLGFRGQIVLVAMRPIGAGEVLSFDYAMSDGSPYDEFRCHCGSSRCRRWITGDDWRRPPLWDRYRGYFSPYLARRIARLQAGPSHGAQIH